VKIKISSTMMMMTIKMKSKRRESLLRPTITLTILRDFCQSRKKSFWKRKDSMPMKSRKFKRYLVRIQPKKLKKGRERLS
jgi:sulfate adenylyltransferase subunit 1 (EFTu-like GTPase family)